MKVVLSTAYWPNLHYFCYVLASSELILEKHENYSKQSFRNRTSILSANGKLDLVIPVKHKEQKMLVSDVEISYVEKWQIKHWRAITSAYKNSPFFEFFEDEIKPFYFQEYPNLFEYNLEQLKLLLKIMRVKKQISFTETFLPAHNDAVDARALIHPKADHHLDKQISPLLRRTYYQTFGNKFGFTENLSVLDLLFNQGLESRSYFPSETLTL